MEGAGTMSITVWIRHVERESHCEKMRESRWRVSFDLRSRGGIFKLSAPTIFVTFSVFLREQTLIQFQALVVLKDDARIEHYSIIDSPYIF